MKINFNENRSTELANFDIEFSEGFVAKGVKLISGKDGKPDFLTHSYSYKVEKDEKGNGWRNVNVGTFSTELSDKIIKAVKNKLESL